MSSLKDILSKELLTEQDMDTLVSAYVNEMMGKGVSVSIQYDGVVDDSNIQKVTQSALFKIAFQYYFEKLQNEKEIQS